MQETQDQGPETNPKPPRAGLGAWLDRQPLGLKLLYSLLLAALIPGTVGGYIFYRLTTQSLSRIEQMRVREANSSVDSAFRYERDQLLTQVGRYAYWDQTVRAIRTRDRRWLDHNLTGWIPSHFPIQIVVLTDEKGRTVDRPAAICCAPPLRPFAPLSSPL